MNQPGDGGGDPIVAERGGVGKAVSWSFVMTGGRQLVSFLVMLLLAAMLGPEEFGIVALAALYVSLLEIFVLNGLSPALVQRSHLVSGHLDAAFLMSLALSGVLVLLSIGLGGLWSGLNDAPQLYPVLISLTLILPIRAFQLVPEALLRRSMKFRDLALRENAAVLVGGVTGIAFAIGGAGVWALVAQQITTAAVGCAVLWHVTDWRPSFRFERSKARDLLPFASSNAVGSVGMFIRNRSDALVIGLFFGVVAIGIYRLANRIVMTVIDVLVRSLQGVSLPALSAQQHDREAFGSRLTSFIGLSARLAIPVLAATAVSADEVIQMLGSAWTDASLPMRILCIAGMARAIGAFGGPVLQALGKPHWQAVYLWASALASATAYLVVGRLLRTADTEAQVAVMALTTAIVTFVLLVASLSIVVRVTSATVGAVLRAIAPALVGGGVAVTVGVAVRWGLDRAGAAPFVTLVFVFGAALAASFGMLASWDPMSRRVWDGVMARISALRRRGVVVRNG